MKFRVANLISKHAHRRELLAFATGLAFVATLPVAASSAESLTPHAAVERSGELSTAYGLTLHLNADLGSVTIETLPPKAPPVVRYTVHIETDAREPLAQALLEKYALSARATPAGVTISGALPSLRTAANRNAQFWVQFVITVPANFNVEVATGAGDI